MSEGKCNNGQFPCVKPGISCTHHCYQGRKCENNEPNMQNKNSNLSLEDNAILLSPTGCFTDKHMFLANKIVQRDYPNIDGLQDTLL